MWEEIETEEDYREALRRFLEICDASKNSDEEKELYVLIERMEKYEQKNNYTTI